MSSDDHNATSSINIDADIALDKKRKLSRDAKSVKTEKKKKKDIVDDGVVDDDDDGDDTIPATKNLPMLLPLPIFLHNSNNKVVVSIYQ